jgi:hypothetical protein
MEEILHLRSVDDTVAIRIYRRQRERKVDGDWQVAPTEHRDPLERVEPGLLPDRQHATHRVTQSGQPMYDGGRERFV